ncbi:probable leucine-rich repeat receptor-like serine/threonine-protein kinase At3g14840 isoform X2 [Helianthus annuus]|uniref:probable leucine-rich repeat receptor-like serine/threonine-protein kinase At3g14840 isoform X2 n=1 Tax=Helianthus annuus TaxID=4232 RepID=UPI000B8F0B5B|nr:probable leucine-rich repeat receptor-like serine/threonine-protein kinase At3g14840 isoform X2 [Helianthus annuus]
MLLVILCVTFLPFAFASIDITCLPSEEVDALREIGRKLGKLEWDFRQDPCHAWEISSDGPRENNVTCNPEPNSTICHVVSISLKGQNLTGTLPPEFVNLLYLQNLDLTRNYLSGTIPPQWGSMERILNISLLANRLNGSLPKEFGNISTLKSLSVEDNRMSGAIPVQLGSLRSIERLLLSSNFFTGELPASFANLISMKDFRISSNNFSGKIPDFIGEWKNLTSLRIQASGLEGPIPLNITLLTTLTDLRISDLRGPDTLCPPFENTSFKNLILRSCNLIGEIPKSIASSKLLDLNFNKLNGSIPERFIDLQDTDYIYLTGNLLSGTVPNWMTTSADNVDLSYNVFESNRDLRCQMRQTNLFASFSTDNISRKVSCLGDSSCPTNWTSLYINCGGRKLTDGKKEYESDLQEGGASDFSAVESRWGFSNTGNFLDDNNHDSYIVSGVPTNTSELYMNARTSALSLTYYGFCMHDGSYNVSLHFAEIFFTDDETYSSLGRRVFDIYIQGVQMEKDFDISDRAGGAMKAIVTSYTVNVTGSLEIRLYWARKGTTNIPSRGVYGPLISAISVDPNYHVPQSGGNGNGVSRGIVAGIAGGAVCAIILILGVLWWCGYLRCRDAMELDLHGLELHDLELNTGSFTLKQLKIATNNFDVANKIGEGGFGSVYKGVLPNGTLMAVKQLSSKSKQGNREFLNELGMISALQHPHLVKLYGCCIEGNQLLLAYEYMENNSLARALFGPKEWQLALDWPTRYRICIDIARGLAFLHEESRLKIVHRDIKATNVLLDKDLNAKISDFGLAKLDEEDNTHISTRVAGTYGYMAPEYAMRGYLTDKADVYSYGIVLLEIVSGMANIADRAKENHFVLLDRAIALKAEGNLVDLVDSKLGSEYDISEMMVVINLALMCTAISPADRPTMSSVVSMLEGRIVPEAFIAEQSHSMTKMDRDKLMKLLEIKNENQTEEMSFTYTDSSTSAVDLYPVNDFSEYLQKRDSDAKKLLS